MLAIKIAMTLHYKEVVEQLTPETATNTRH
jgi:hypothetical protein